MKKLCKFLLSGILVVLASGLIFPLDLFAEEPPEKVTLDVRDADLREVLLNLSAKAKINLMLSPKVKGTITCRVSDIKPRELIDFIVRANGYIIEEHGKILLVLGESTGGNNIRVEVIPLMNAKAAEVEKIIQSLKLDKRAKVSHDERTNRLIVVYEY